MLSVIKPQIVSNQPNRQNPVIGPARLVNF
jgi:hypothetical protein